MSPVWIKLGDFGVSKLILAGATTTFHTQVSTPLYSAPEVLGLDSNSETSDYTNSVDIWSLGCVIYELLVGTKLFVSEFHVSRYFFGKWLFPEERLRGLSPPIDEIGISLLKSMLAIQPEDRPSAVSALGNAWLTSLKSDDEDSGDDQDETTQSGDERTCNEESEGNPTTRDKPKKRRGQRNPITQDDSKCAPRDVALEANLRPQWGSDPTTHQSEIDTAMTIRGAEEKMDPQYSTNMSPK